MSHHHEALCHDLIGIIASHIAYYGNDTVLYRVQHIFAKLSPIASRLATLSRPLVMTLNISNACNTRMMPWTIPCTMSDGAEIVIDWGDYCLERVLSRRQLRYPGYRYEEEGMYAVRVYRIGESGTGGLLHLGWSHRAKLSVDRSYMTEPQRVMELQGTMFFSLCYSLFPLTHLQSLGNVGIIDLSRCCAYINESPTFGRVDTRSVINMCGLFYRANKFNSPIQHLDTSKVTDMSQMFCKASQFNQPLNAWNTSSVTTMEEMFRLASAFNQSLHAWNTSKVVTMRDMFSQCPYNNDKICACGT